MLSTVRKFNLLKVFNLTLEHLSFFKLKMLKYLQCTQMIVHFIHILYYRIINPKTWKQTNVQLEYVFYISVKSLLYAH